MGTTPLSSAFFKLDAPAAVADTSVPSHIPFREFLSHDHCVAYCLAGIRFMLENQQNQLQRYDDYIQSYAEGDPKIVEAAGVRFISDCLQLIDVEDRELRDIDPGLLAFVAIPDILTDMNGFAVDAMHKAMQSGKRQEITAAKDIINGLDDFSKSLTLWQRSVFSLCDEADRMREWHADILIREGEGAFDGHHHTILKGSRTELMLHDRQDYFKALSTAYRQMYEQGDKLGKYFVRLDKIYARYDAIKKGSQSFSPILK